MVRVRGVNRHRTITALAKSAEILDLGLRFPDLLDEALMTSSLRA